MDMPKRDVKVYATTQNQSGVVIHDTPLIFTENDEGVLGWVFIRNGYDLPNDWEVTKWSYNYKE